MSVDTSKLIFSYIRPSIIINMRLIYVMLIILYNSSSYIKNKFDIDLQFIIKTHFIATVIIPTNAIIKLALRPFK